MIYDSIRKKNVPKTPEEIVRQNAIQFLLQELHVPAHFIEVEFALSKITPHTKDRVDILVMKSGKNFKENEPWLLVECKAPGEYTMENLQIQLNKYLQFLKPSYVFLALGDKNLFFSLDTLTNRFVQIRQLPLYR